MVRETLAFCMVAALFANAANSQEQAPSSDEQASEQQQQTSAEPSETASSQDIESMDWDLGFGDDLAASAERLAEATAAEAASAERLKHERRETAEVQRAVDASAFLAREATRLANKADGDPNK